jgi:manganese/zinc/iron transport system permease protein
MMWEWFTQPNAQWVLAGSLLLGFNSGVLGAFAMLRRRSLMGDALAHAALPGVCLAFLIFSSKSLGVLFLGALLASLLGAWLIQAIVRHSRIKEDAALGTVLSVFFAIGIVLLTVIQHSSQGHQAGLDKFLFGQAASLVGDDLKIMAISAGGVCLAIFLLFKEFKILCFDAGFAAGLGFSPKKLDSLLLLLLVVVVVIGLQAVGVVLISALLITPAAAARLWTHRLGRMVWLSGLIGLISGAVGVWGSALAPRMPTGPLIVLSATGIFGVSLLLAPERGLIARFWRLAALRMRTARENVLRSIYESAEAAGHWDAPCHIEQLARQRNVSPAVMSAYLDRLEKQGLIWKSGEEYRMTEQGLAQAYRLVRHRRLWEMLLMHEQELNVGTFDRAGEFKENKFSRELIKRLEELLRQHDREPKIPLA